MPDFFNTLYKMFLKQKSKLFFVLLFFIIAGILIPNIQPVSASWIDCFKGGAIGFGFGGAVGAVVGCNAAAGTVSYVIQAGAKAFIGTLLVIPLFISALFSL